MKTPLKAFLILIYTASFAVASAFTQTQPSPAQQPAAPAHQASGPANGPGDSGLGAARAAETISVKDDRLTLKVVNRAMDSVVGLITRTTRFPIVDTEGALDGRRVNFDFRDMPVDEALRLILKGYDAFFLYAGDGDTTSSLRQVWIYPKGQGQGFDPIRHEVCASSKELRQMVRDRDPRLQTRAFQALIEREGSKSRDVVVQWVNSGDEQQRNLALFYALENNVQLPVESLINLVRADNSPAIRVMALDALAGADPSITQGVLQQTLNDPDARVRARAQEILDALNPSAAAASTDQTK